MKESAFQAKTIARIKEQYPECIVLKNDANYKQGIPDVLVLNGDAWAALEFKSNSAARHQPNQDYYVGKMNEMSYASFVDPSNVEEVFDGLQKTFRPKR